MKSNGSLTTKHIGASISKLGRRLLNLRKSFWWPPLALIIVAGVWLNLKADIPLPEKYSNEKFGQYGDSFGALTSLFTALGFGGLIITLLLQQRQIRSQEDSDERNRRKEAQAQYENVLFRLLEIYRQNLAEIQNGEIFGRDVLLKSIERVEQGLIGEAVHTLPVDMQGRSDSKTLNDSDKRRIEYLHFRNFKIIAAEINPQGRLLDTFEVLLGHMVDAPDYLLISPYKDLVFAQITYIEMKYFFLVALSVANRAKLRDLMHRSGILDRISRSSTHLIHRQMYEIYWKVAVAVRGALPSMPMSDRQIDRACKAHREASGKPRTTYTPIRARPSSAKAFADANALRRQRRKTS